MKKTAILMAAMFTATLVNAQKVPEKEVPAHVKSAFQKQFPDAKETKWEKENGNYEVGFEIKKTAYAVLIDASGNTLETEMEIGMDALPAATKDYISKNHFGKKIKEATKITDAKGAVTYEIEIKGTDLIFDNTGNFIKEEVKNDND